MLVPLIIQRVFHKFFGKILRLAQINNRAMSVIETPFSAWRNWRQGETFPQSAPELRSGSEKCSPGSLILVVLLVSNSPGGQWSVDWHKQRHLHVRVQNVKGRWCERSSQQCDVIEPHWFAFRSCALFISRFMCLWSGSISVSVERQFLAPGYPSCIHIPRTERAAQQF